MAGSGRSRATTARRAASIGTMTARPDCSAATSRYTILNNMDKFFKLSELDEFLGMLVKTAYLRRRAS